MLTTIRDALAASDLNDLKALVADRHPEWLARELPELEPAERAIVFRVLPKDTALRVFELMHRNDRAALIEAMTTPEAVEMIELLDADDRIHVLDELPARVAKRLVGELTGPTRQSVQTMLGYDTGSVGRMLSPHYVAVRTSATADEALDVVRTSVLRPEHLSTVFVVDDSRRYRGLVRLADLFRADGDRPIGDLTEASEVGVPTTEDAATAARLLQRRDLDAVPVVDSEYRLVGAVTADDAMDAIETDTTATMYGIAGITDPGHNTELIRSERMTKGPIRYSVRVRLMFLMITLAGGLLVGGLIDAFEDSLAAVVAIAVFIPLVMDMGGNVGTQSTTIFARGLALGHIDPNRIWRHIWREMRVGVAMATVIALIGGTAALLWQGVPNGIPQLGLAVGISLFVSVNLACFLGFFLPWLLTKIGLDHAPGADPFMTTIKDFTGLLVYFGLAVWVLDLV
jgi:magnesium transporter